MGRDLYDHAYIDWEKIDLWIQIWWIFGYHPDLADHRSSNNAFGMLSSWVHARAGASQGYHTCYVKFKFAWRYFNYWFGLYFPRSTNWLMVSFKVYVYW